MYPIMKTYSGSIYMIVNLINNKKYVGQTQQTIEERFRKHKSSNSCPKLYNALKKYGESNFKIFTLKVIAANKYSVLAEQLDEWEKFYIKYYNSVENGYNLTYGGQNKLKQLSEETKKKISEAQKGEKGNMWGKHHSDETKEKISKKVSETRIKKYGKPVIQLSLDGTFIKEWNSIKEAAASFDSKRSHIADVCNGVRNSCFGYKWKWVNEVVLGATA